MGTILIIFVVGGVIYLGSKSEYEPTPTTPTTSPAVTTTLTPTTPLNDTDAISQLLSNYHESVRTKSLDGLMSLFTDDPRLITQDKLTFSGKNQVMGYYSYLFRELKGPIGLRVLDASLNLVGSKATARIEIADSGKLGLEFFELVKVRGLWRISNLTLSDF